MLNIKLYSLGAEIEKRYLHLSDEEWDKLKKDLAWNAYYNDNYKVESIAEGYFLIVEVYGIEMANDYLRYYENDGQVA